MVLSDRSSEETAVSNRSSVSDGVPTLPRDVEDDQCDYEADDRIRDLQAERNQLRTGEDAEADEPSTRAWFPALQAPLVLVELDELAGLGRADDAPRVPGDLEDDERDRESDQRIGDAGP